MDAEPDQQNDDTSNLRLIDAVRNDDLPTAQRLINEGVPIQARDGADWSALDWAAGRGDVPVIKLLLDAGADVMATGKEQRRPYQIALAAGRREAIGVLAAAEDRVDPHAVDARMWRPYCRAYRLAELRNFAGWSAAERADELDEDQPVVFLHDDFTVTRDIWRGEDVVFDDVTDEWRRFCTDELGFRVPRDIDLVVSAGPPE